VLGTHKFVYDIWGDAVNTAKRMESHGLPGRMHVSTRQALGNAFRFEPHGLLEVKGKGSMETYFLYRQYGPQFGLGPRYPTRPYISVRWVWQ
jgi:adenylate cyclase